MLISLAGTAAEYQKSLPSLLLAAPEEDYEEKER